MHRITTTTIALVALFCLSGESVQSRTSTSFDEAWQNELAVSLSLPGNDTIVVQFVNQGVDTIRILKPLDGSFHSWVMPYYSFTYDDGTGPQCDLIPRCGHFGHPYFDTTWPDDYVVQLRPGESHQEAFRLSDFIAARGDFTIRFEYVLRPESEILEAFPPSDLRYPPGIWRGKAVAQPIRIRYRP